MGKLDISYLIGIEQSPCTSRDHPDNRVLKLGIIERYSKSLTFDDALQLYKQVNRSEV